MKHYCYGFVVVAAAVVVAVVVVVVAAAADAAADYGGKSSYLTWAYLHGDVDCMIAGVSFQGTFQSASERT